MLLNVGPQVVRHPVQKNGDREECARHQDAQREDVEREVVHDARLWILHRRRTLSGDGRTRVHVRRNGGDDHQRDHQDDDVQTREVDGPVSAERHPFRGGLNDVRRERHTEQPRVEEVLNLVDVEDVVAVRPCLLGRHAQLAEARAHPVERTQHVEQTDEHRDLRQHRQTSEQGIEPVLLLELLHLLGHLDPVFAVLLADRLHLRLDLLHLPRGADLLHKRLVEDRAQGEDKEDNRQGPGDAGAAGGVGENVAEQPVPHPHDRRDRPIDEIEHVVSSSLLQQIPAHRPRVHQDWVPSATTCGRAARESGRNPACARDRI